jgi:hypothetical protein
MNARTLAELALKIWGIILVVSALASLPVTLLMAASGAGNDPQAGLMRMTQIASILGLVIQAAVGTAVLVWADRITDLIKSDTAPIQIDTSIDELQALGFALAGVFILVSGLQNVASAAYVLLSRPKFDETNPLTYMWTRQDEAIVRAVVQVVAGALLIFGRETIARGWSALRGQPVNDDVDESRDDEGNA